MTTPDPELPPGGPQVRVVTFGTRSRLVALVALVLVGATLLVLGATVVVVLLGVVAALVVVALVGGAFGAVVGAVRTLIGGRREAPRTAPVERPDPSLEVFPDPPERRVIAEGNDGRDA